MKMYEYKVEVLNKETNEWFDIVGDTIKADSVDSGGWSRQAKSLIVRPIE